MSVVVAVKTLDSFEREIEKVSIELLEGKTGLCGLLRLTPDGERLSLTLFCDPVPGARGLSPQESELLLARVRDLPAVCDRVLIPAPVRDPGGPRLFRFSDEAKARALAILAAEGGGGDDDDEDGAKR